MHLESIIAARRLMRPFLRAGVLAGAAALCACFGGSDVPQVAATPTPTPNVVAVVIDAGPAAAAGQINHAYLTVKVCPSGSQTGCANIDHVLLDTGSTGLRLVGSVLTAAGVALSTAMDSSGQQLEECVSFSGGQVWGPVASADITLASEVALRVPVQIMDDAATSAPPPATCGANGSLINSVSGFGANGVLGIGVLLYDCGADCVAPAAPPPFYYGCTSAGVCTAENVPLTDQVTNVVALFPIDNNGFIVKLPNLVNANGDSVLQGELLLGLSTQSDNDFAGASLTVLGADATGRFSALYNGAGSPLPSLIDSGTDAYSFDDPSMAVCSSGAFIGYYCPAVAPQTAFAVNTGLGNYPNSNTVNFAIADPNTFVAGAAALAGLGGGGGSTSFTWGMPFFYGRAVYFGLDQHSAGGYSGPFYAY
jgi:hypothetical protein